MMAAVTLMGWAAIRAQTAYRYRWDEPLIAGIYTNSAIRFGLAGMVCFIVVKVLG